MQVTGQMCLNQLKILKNRASTFETQFADTLYAFSDDEKQKPQDVVAKYEVTQAQMAALQDAQARINTSVTVTVAGKSMSLLTAIKYQGVASRIAEQWKSARVAKKKARSWQETEHVRDSSQERAERTVSVDEADKLFEAASIRSTKFQAAVSKGNQVPVELNIEPGLFADFE